MSLATCSQPLIRQAVRVSTYSRQDSHIAQLLKQLPEGHRHAAYHKSHRSSQPNHELRSTPAPPLPPPQRFHPASPAMSTPCTLCPHVGVGGSTTWEHSPGKLRPLLPPPPPPSGRITHEAVAAMAQVSGAMHCKHGRQAAAAALALVRLTAWPAAPTTASVLSTASGC